MQATSGLPSPTGRLSVPDHAPSRDDTPHPGRHAVRRSRYAARTGEILEDSFAGRPIALRDIKREEVLDRAFDYWRNIDKTIGDQIEAATKSLRRE